MMLEQYSSWYKCSCLANLIGFLGEVIMRIEIGERVEVCYLDFQENFYSVNHRLPDQKMKVLKMKFASGGQAGIIH